MPELQLSHLLADLTHLKTLSPRQALLLITGPPPHTPSLPKSKDDSDAELVRAHEFLRLRGEEVGRSELEKKRGEVERALRGEEEEDVKQEVEERGGWGGSSREGSMPRMVGGWGRWNE